MYNTLKVVLCLTLRLSAGRPARHAGLSPPEDPHRAGLHWTQVPTAPPIAGGTHHGNAECLKCLETIVYSFNLVSE